MKDRNKAIPASYLFLIKNNKVLMLRRAHTTYFDGYYSVPAGHIEAGELPVECMIREAKEEIGISIKKKDLVLAHTLYRTKHDITGDRVDYFFVAKNFTGKIENKELHKCDDLEWFPLNKLPKKITPEVRQALALYRRKIIYSEMPFNIKDVNPTKRENNN